MDEESRVEKVDRYLQNQMSLDEQKDFELMLTENQVLQKFVDDQRKLVNGLKKYQERENFLDMLKGIKEEQPKEKVTPIIDLASTTKEPKKQVTKIRKLSWKLAYAASIAIVITALIFVFQRDLDPAALATNNFAFHADILSANLEVSGATEDINMALLPLLREGIQAYNQGAYNIAEKQFEDFRSQSIGRNYLVILNDFYLAQIALSNDKTDFAISLLTPLVSEKGLPIETAVNWYLALAYLKNGDKIQARKLLQTLQLDAVYGSKANLILNKL